MPWSRQSVLLVLGTREWGGALRLPEAWQVAWTAGFRYSQRALEAGARPVRLSFTGSSNHLHQTLLRLSGSQRALRAISSSTPALSETDSRAPLHTCEGQQL